MPHHRNRSRAGAHGSCPLCAVLLAAIVWLCLAAQVQASPPRPEGLLPASALPAHAALDLGVLRRAYPGAVAGMARDAAGRLVLVLAGGRRLPYDDGRVRTAEEAEEAQDLRTMLAQVYPLGTLTPQTARPAPGFDPGRHRVQAFFAALYGADEDEARAACRRVAFDGHAALMNARHGAAEALARVWARIAPLAGRADVRRALRPFGGSFCWRHIAATDRLSAHAYGIAVDLNSRLPYWHNERHPARVPGIALAFPAEVLEAFEAEGFIWGGKWSAFDLMHFEYRPELLLKARVLRGELPPPAAD